MSDTPEGGCIGVYRGMEKIMETAILFRVKVLRFWAKTEHPLPHP